MVTITNGYIKLGVQFRPPTPPSSSSKKDSLHIGSSPNGVFIPLLWDMDEIYGIVKDPY
jgi:hypothetical protein